LKLLVNISVPFKDILGIV